MKQPGVLIFKGMTVGFLPGDLFISLDNIEESKAILSTSYNVIPSEVIDGWKRNRTSRAKKIVEVIRRTYKLKPNILKDFSACIKEIMKYRDSAVHPSLELKNSYYRDDINVGVDWKFASYQYSNVKRFLTNTINIIVYLYENKSGIKEIDESIANVIDAIQELKIVK